MRTGGCLTRSALYASSVTHPLVRSGGSIISVLSLSLSLLSASLSFSLSLFLSLSSFLSVFREAAPLPPLWTDLLPHVLRKLCRGKAHRTSPREQESALQRLRCQVRRAGAPWRTRTESLRVARYPSVKGTSWPSSGLCATASRPAHLGRVFRFFIGASSSPPIIVRFRSPVTIHQNHHYQGCCPTPCPTL